MKAVVYHRPGHVEVNEVDDPKIQDPQDIVVRVSLTAICGSDLHIYNGFFPQLKDMVMGHEFMGVVEEAGSDVNDMRKGDRVVVPFPIACGACFFCQHELPGHCENSNPKHYGPEGALLSQKGGGLFGYTDLYGGYAGGQSEYVRVPYSNFGPRKIADAFEDEEVLFLTDIFPTGYTAIDWAGVYGGETVAVFGCGPVGLMAQKVAWLRGAKRVIGVDIQEYRLAAARETAKSETINAQDDDPIKAIREVTDGRGADVCVDAVGMEADRNIADKLGNIWRAEIGSTKVLENCISAVRRGGFVSVAGVCGIPYKFPLGQVFDKGIKLAFGQAPVQKYIDELLTLIEQRKIKLNDIITHRLPLEKAPEAYEIFSEKKDGCVKVVLQP